MGALAWVAKMAAATVVVLVVLGAALVLGIVAALQLADLVE